MRRTGDCPVATFDDHRAYNLHTLYSCRNKSSLNAKCFLGIINSRLLKFIYQSKMGTEVGRTFAEIKIVYVRQLPVQAIDLDSATHKQLHDRIVRLVDQMLTLKKSLQSKDFDTEREPIERQIKATDAQIDRLVYELYGLTEDEIAIVEAKTQEK